VGLAWLAGERLQPLQWVGAGLVVAAVMAISLRSSPQREA
jgi:drug/metabolite transporter (DMT)-like permease